MSNLQNNLNILLDKKRKLAAELLTHIKPADQLVIRETNSGYPTGVYKGLYIHSRYNPKVEAEKIIQATYKEPHDTAVFFGFGLGYTVQCYLKTKPNTNILVIEPDISFFLKALQTRDMTSFLGNRVLHFAFGNKPDEILDILENIRAENIKIFKNRVLYQKDSNYYEKVENLIIEYSKRKKININTLKRFGKIWIRNLIRNLFLLTKYPGISVLENKFRNIPSLIIAAGPSLDYLIEKILPLKEKMLIVAVDTAVKPLINAGIEPDFIIIVDPQYWNTKYLERTDLQKAFFISEPATHPRNFKLIDFKGFWIRSFFPLGQYFENLIGNKGTLGAGGSVTTTAWDFARYIGSKKIYLAGMDLGFPWKRIHCKGTSLEELWYINSKRLQPTELFNFEAMLSGNPYYDKSYNGQNISTDERMSVYKHWFETQVSRYPNIKTLNISPYSLKIKGIGYCEASTLEDSPTRRNEIESILYDIENIFTTKNRSLNLVDFKNSLTKLIDDLETIYKLAKSGEMYNLQLGEKIKRGEPVESILDKLENLDKSIMSMKTRDIAGFLLHGINEIIHTSENQPNNTDLIINNSIKLYRELGDSANYHIRLLKKLLTSI